VNVKAGERKGFRMPIFTAIRGYLETGYDMVSPEAPALERDENREQHAERTYDSDDKDESEFQEEKFSAVRVPYRGSETITFESFQKIYPDLKEDKRDVPIPLEYARKTVEKGNSTKNIVIRKQDGDDTISFNYTIGDSFERVTDVIITKVGVNPEDPSFYAVQESNTTLNYSGGIVKKIESYNREEYEGRPPEIQYVRSK
jgi:hypothetical protein